MNVEDEFEDGVAYSARPLKGRAEFEVKIVSCGVGCRGSLHFGVMRCKKGELIESSPSIPSEINYGTMNHCV